MSRIGEYYLGRRAKEAELQRDHESGFLYVTAVTGTPAIEVNIETGARLVVEGKHRESTEAEIELLRKVSQENVMQSQAQTLRTQGRVALPAISIGKE